MRAGLLSIAATGSLLGLAMPTPVAADPPIGSLIDRSSKGLTKRFNPRHMDSPRPAMNVYFRCVASLNRTKVEKVLELPYGSDEQRAAATAVQPARSFSDARQQDCFSNFGDMKMSYDPLTAIGGFAEYFALYRFDKEDAAEIAGLTKDDWQAPGLMPRNGSEMVGFCVAQAGGESVFDLVSSEPETPEENAALKQIIPLLGPCLTDGMEVKFDKTSLRSMLAHGLFKVMTEMAALKEQAT